MKAPKSMYYRYRISKIICFKWNMDFMVRTPYSNYL